MLGNAQPRDNGMTSILSPSERQDIENKLDACRAKQTVITKA